MQSELKFNSKSKQFQLFFFFLVFRRYRDKEQSDSPDNVVTSAPTFKSDDIKKPISVKTTVKALPAVAPTTSAAASTAVRGAKKIDMGAALNYGKASDLGINSPTHRNTHSEDLFGDEPVVKKIPASRSNNDIIEDIFSSASSSDPVIDDFDPRAEETAPDFGDFATAFGSSDIPTKAPVVAPVATEFADFSSAFSSTSKPAFSSAAALPPVDNFLFTSQPAPIQSSNSLLGSADLFGNSVITSAFTSPIGGNKDLLSDFGDLTLNPIQGEHFKKKKLQLILSFFLVSSSSVFFIA